MSFLTKYAESIAENELLQKDIGRLNDSLSRAFDFIRELGSERDALKNEIERLKAEIEEINELRPKMPA